MSRTIPIAAYSDCFCSTVNADPVFSHDQTNDADQTMTSPRMLSMAVQPSTR